MKKTKTENLLAGLTDEAQAGTQSKPNMKHGEETTLMLLALLNSPLESMINSQQARILGRGMTKHGMSTIVIFYGVQPTSIGTLEPVGNAER